MIRRDLILIGVLVAALPPAATAQTSPFRPSASVLFARPAVNTAWADTLNLPRTYWIEGAVITGIPSAVFGGMLGYGFCGYDSGSAGENCVLQAIGGALLLGVAGAIPGALIGGLFEKPQ
ncbi:MAG: hypothetical protein ABJB33_03565 [Gemmatimonadota bacterium]